MHSDESRELIDCAACGAVIAPETDRACEIADEVFLCWQCALARGGRFDEAEDRWTAMPNAADVPIPASVEGARRHLHT